MKFGVTALAAIGIVGLSGAAVAQTPPPRTGFQMDIRTGYSVPMGKAWGVAKLDNQLSDISGGQVPIIVDIGAKVIPELFVGGYLALAFGGPGGRLKDDCERMNADCASVAVHAGVEAQYHILPGRAVNPWLGYGLGFESLGIGRTVNGVSTSAGFSGFEFARFMAGVDFRITRVFGVGPFVDLSMASYGTYNDGSTSRTIPETATHEWLTLGARFVFFP
jgi:hypothetical protein